MFKAIGFEMRHNIFATGHFTEDGDFLEGSTVLVVAELSNGQRFARYVGSTTVEASEEGFNYSSSPEELLHTGVMLAAKLNQILEWGRQPRLNFSFWAEIDPVYGSEYYQSSGAEEALIEFERSQY